jgi:hypothetical protein
VHGLLQPHSPDDRNSPIRSCRYTVLHIQHEQKCRTRKYLGGIPPLVFSSKCTKNFPQIFPRAVPRIGPYTHWQKRTQPPNPSTARTPGAGLAAAWPPARPHWPPRRRHSSHARCRNTAPQARRSWLDQNDVSGHAADPFSQQPASPMNHPSHKEAGGSGKPKTKPSNTSTGHVNTSTWTRTCPSCRPGAT